MYCHFIVYLNKQKQNENFKRGPFDIIVGWSGPGSHRLHKHVTTYDHGNRPLTVPFILILPFNWHHRVPLINMHTTETDIVPTQMQKELHYNCQWSCYLLRILYIFNIKEKGYPLLYLSFMLVYILLYPFMTSSSYKHSCFFVCFLVQWISVDWFHDIWQITIYDWDRYFYW